MKQLPVKSRTWQRLSPNARRAVAALDASNAEDSTCWWVGLVHLSRLMDVDTLIAASALDELRAARVIDFLFVFDDTHTSVIVAVWARRELLIAQVAERLHRPDTDTRTERAA